MATDSAATEAGQSAQWAAAVQVEQYRAARLTALMQAITGIPVFTGNPEDLEFFLGRMDLIVQQLAQNPLDESSNNYIVGYFYSRISFEVLQEIGATCDTAWKDIKVALREKYGGAARSIPRLILREVLFPRENGESATVYAKAVLRGVQKVRNRLKDSVRDEEERRVRNAMLEELASEMLAQNLPRRVRQWVKIVKPQTLEQLVKTVEDDEAEEKEDRWEETRRRSQRIRGEVERPSGEWRRVERKERTRPSAPGGRSGNGNLPVRSWNEQRRWDRRIGKVDARGGWRSREVESSRNGRFECWQCKEIGHFARECPYIFRRDRQRGQQTFGRKITRDEPMEVNAARRAGESSLSDSESEGSSGELSGSQWSSSRGGRREGKWDRIRRPEWPKLPQRAEKAGFEKKNN